MSVYQSTITVSTSGQGTYEITPQVADVLKKSGLRRGTATVFVRHTSCSLVIMENADPTAREDLENFLDKLVPENDPSYAHTLEGPDDMPAHIKMALTRTSEAVPFDDGRMALGTWQGIYLWEHRRAPHTRSIVLSFTGE